jgi:uncharacterized protein YdeI (YjbR/CyaY-like superfamily)
VSTSLSSARPASPAEAPILLFAHAHEWAAWLEAHHAASRGAWLQLARKGTTLRSLPYAEAVDVALCYGWIDSLTRRHDDRSRVQKFTPRRTRSSWSRINCDKVAALAAAGRMRPAGLLAVERVRATGRWCGGDPTA